MPSTHLSLHYHLVFSTKDRSPIITPSYRPRLHAFLGGIPEAIGGVADHVHLLIGLRATHGLADVMREVKTVSSKWVHEEIGERAFQWQEEHHRTRTYQEEYVDFLDRGGVEYDERYLW